MIDLRNCELSQLALDSRGRVRLAKQDAGYVSAGELLTPVQPGGDITVDWLAQWTAPQTWHKHAGNPIFGPAQTGDWDTWTNGVSIVPTEGDTKYHMYYCGRKGAGIGFAVADVSDPLTWKEHPASPVIKPRADNWEGDMLNQPRVVKVTDTHWRMYYTGWGFKGKGTNWAMGLAESFDGGVTWKRYQDDPIMDRDGDDSPDGGGACVPMVVRVGEQWMMWYTAGQLSAAGNQNIHLCLATSDDGIKWKKHPGNPVLTDDFSDNAKRSVTSRCYVRHEEGVYRMWYSFAKPNYQIYYAESLDGIDWERGPIGPVLPCAGVGGPEWDAEMVEYPEVQIVDGQWRMWFCGNGFGTVGFARGEVDTTLAISIRSGDTENIGQSWSDWQPVARGQRIATGKFAQLRAQFTSKRPEVSAALNSLVITHE
jgi:predicted GH43/DUF377 family glycosyl hydrolase